MSKTPHPQGRSGNARLTQPATRSPPHGGGGSGEGEGAPLGVSLGETEAGSSHEEEWGLEGAGTMPGR